MTNGRRTLPMVLAACFVLGLAACGGLEERERAYASIKNDFNNPEMPKRPQWTICKSSYLGVDFGRIDLDATSAELEVEAGLDYVLMVASWEDPTCSIENTLPIASRNEEEIVPGQRRTISINMPNHQGPCPPEGVAPIPQVLYDRILALWPEFGFLPYEQRTQNPECL
ncbi:MAG: hypothetical protein JXP73_01505 [Deltaproteobacteria bacterium]|jgi:hypothetical protein|nr:hypothetical protein [Deltaproteobacteria bacterium]